VTIEGLRPSTTYYYRVGDPMLGFSPTYTFKTLPAVGAGRGSFPMRIGVIGDLGQTYNSSSTLDHLSASNAQAVMVVGDFTYADEHLTNDTIVPELRGIFNVKYAKQTYQPRWDTWGRFTEPVVSTRPMLHNHGNHEIETQVDGTTFASYDARYPIPNSNSSNNRYYSWNMGAVHGIMITSYTDFYPGSPQYEWLVADLAEYDRGVTPWLIVDFHAPWYNTYTSHYKENECMRQTLEQMLYDAGVDLIITGHVHAYERTNPVLDYKINLCAPVHLTVGDGGNCERIVYEFVDEPGKCPDPMRKQPAYQPQSCPSFQDDDGGYCPTSQPIWSAYREPSFGHGTLDVVNTTHAHWQWHRNQDGFDVVSDSYWVVRNPEMCPNRAYRPKERLE
jgi:Icc-related predicted phosphoesterase